MNPLTLTHLRALRVTKPDSRLNQLVSTLSDEMCEEKLLQDQ